MREPRPIVAVAIVLAAGATAGCASAAREADDDAQDGSIARDGSSAQDGSIAHDGSVSRDGGPFAPPAVELPDPAQPGDFWLSQTGLYMDVERKQLAPDLREFEPAYALWSDGAEKRRWLRLPPGERIDDSDIDHFLFPVGTMLFKEFSQDGKRLETRLVARVGAGDGDDDYWMGAFVWRDDESDALFMPDGARDVRGTGHDVPEVKHCFTCHDGERGRVLGFSAVQVPDAPPELFSLPPAAFAVPGNAVSAAALGYLHANCAHCHNPHGSARPDTDMDLRLSVADRAPQDTRAYRTTVGVALQYFEDTPLRLRVAPGDPDRSALLFRMIERGPKTQMPPIASEIADGAGIDAVRTWIESL